MCLGIHVAGVGWPYFVLHALLVGAFLIPAAMLQPVSKKQVCLTQCRKVPECNSSELKVA